MANKNDTNELRLKRMVEYIEQDGHEKAEEIDVIAEEEYFMEKRAYMDKRVEAVKKYYDTLESKFQQKSVLDHSKIKNQAYRDILSARNTIVDDVFNKATNRLNLLTEEINACFYKKVLFQLTIQGLVKMMEPNITIEVRKEDVQLAKKILRQAEKYFNEKTGMNCRLVVNESNFLPAKCAGGIIMYTKNSNVSLNNTLDSKLEMVRTNLMSFVRKSLFGANPNRAHTS